MITLLEFLELVSKKIDEDNQKDGVELILGTEHAFKCLNCSKIYTFRYDAERCCK